MSEPPTKKVKFEDKECESSPLSKYIKVTIQPPKVSIFSDDEHKVLKRLYDIHKEFEDHWKYKKLDYTRIENLGNLRFCILNVANVEYEEFNLPIVNKAWVAFNYMNKYFVKKEVNEKLIGKILSIPRTVSYKTKISEETKEKS